MKTMAKYILILIPLFLLNCGEKGPQLVDGPKTPKEIKLEVFPKSVFVGYKIMITASDSVGFMLNASYPQIIFPDSTYVYPDSLRNDTLYATVPYTNKSGILTVNTGTSRLSTDSLTIINNCRTESCVTDWDLNYTINKENSYDSFTQTGWLYQINGDTISISLEANGPNYTIRKYLYFERNPLSPLPKFISGNYFIFTSGMWKFEIDSAIVKIFRWNDNGEFAGKIFTVPNKRSPVSDVFWADSLKH